METYCFKCRARREIQNPQLITLKNGRPATQGDCPSCGTRVFRIEVECSESHDGRVLDMTAGSALFGRSATSRSPGLRGSFR